MRAATAHLALTTTLAAIDRLDEATGIGHDTACQGRHCASQRLSLALTFRGDRNTRASDAKIMAEVAGATFTIQRRDHHGNCKEDNVQEDGQAGHGQEGCSGKGQR